MDFLVLDISKVVTAVVVAIIAFLSRFGFELLTRGRERLKIRASSVCLLDKIINEREWKKSENRLVVEETFEQIYSRKLRFDEIKVLIYAESPSAAISSYLRYRSSFQLNDNKTKFRFSKGKRPYWFFFDGKFRLQKSTIKGVFFYFLLATPASYGLTWLNNHSDDTALDLMAFWALCSLDIVLWAIAVILFLDGMKFQGSEREAVRDIGSKFEL